MAKEISEEDEEEAVERAIKESEIFVSSIFYNFFLFSFYQLLYFIFSILFSPTPHTHDFYLLPTTHDI